MASLEGPQTHRGREKDRHKGRGRGRDGGRARERESDKDRDTVQGMNKLQYSSRFIQKVTHNVPVLFKDPRNPSPSLIILACMLQIV